MAENTSLAAVYATDEHIFVEAGADFGVIVPKSNRIASGTDGAIESADPWTLSSASQAFQEQGASPGMVVRLFGPSSAFAVPQYLAVQAASGNTVLLRRCGLSLGVGQAPVSAAGLSGISFEVLTLAPQIENTAYALNEQFALDPNLPRRRPTDVYDQRIFRRLTALRVTYLQYMSLNRSKAGDFADKQEHYLREYEHALASATVRWGPNGTDQTPTNRFSTRIVRG